MKSIQPAMPASARNSLPPEITEAILLLPVKSLGRFKSVSKTWNSLIFVPRFIKTHLHQNIHRHKTTKLILLSFTRSFYSVEISELFQCLHNDPISAKGKELGFGSPPIRCECIMGSCNGLVLAEDENHKMFLMDPTTQELWEIPISPFALPDEKSFVMDGFGYDSSTDDYKVICISSWITHSKPNPDCTDMFVSVYSSRKNSWRKLPNSPYDHEINHYYRGAHVNENLHRLTSKRPGNSSTIVAFSLADEEFNEIKLPDSIADEEAVYNELIDLGGKLCLFGKKVGNCLWVMEEYGVGESWTRVCIYGFDIGPYEALCLVEGSNRDLVFYDIRDEITALVYNIDERTCRDVRIEGGPSEFFIHGTYVETLESPKRIITPP